MDIFLAILFILICILLIGVVLLQKGRGGGLSGAFGGVGGHSAFGSRTGDMFTWITVVLVALFLLVTTITVRRYRPPAPATA
ncbi:MAG: preprotein translocase subunit SecG, partial [Planctomycetota bacterium]